MSGTQYPARELAQLVGGAQEGRTIHVGADPPPRIVLPLSGPPAAMQTRAGDEIVYQLQRDALGEIVRGDHGKAVYHHAGR